MHMNCLITKSTNVGSEVLLEEDDYEASQPGPIESSDHCFLSFSFPNENFAFNLFIWKGAST